MNPNFGSDTQQEAAHIKWRVGAALGPEPLVGAAHLLQPVAVPPTSPPLLPGPRAGTEFVVDLTGPFPVSAEAVHARLAGRGGELGWFWLWAQTTRTRTVPFGAWQTGPNIPDNGLLSAVALSWELTGLLSEGAATARELAGYEMRLRERFAPLGFDAAAREAPFLAADRAARLIAIKERFARAVEMRLVPAGRAFPARSVWRTLYALGLEWGRGDLFHWYASATYLPLFTVSSLGPPGYFLPERVVEGEGVPGIALSFELPLNPVPLETYDRMSVVLAHLREQWNGRPTTATGKELDADALYDGREALEAAVDELRGAGLPPGSPQAGAFF